MKMNIYVLKDMKEMKTYHSLKFEFRNQKPMIFIPSMSKNEYMICNDPRHVRTFPIHPEGVRCFLGWYLRPYFNRWCCRCRCARRCRCRHELVHSLTVNDGRYAYSNTA